MKNLSKQVVILDNISSPYIHQAIIILKSYPPEQHQKIIEEAEKIVASYFENKSGPEKKYTDNKTNNILKYTVGLLSIAVSCLTFYAFFC